MSGAIRRRDSKGRILFDGEQQKSTGQYEYRYYDGYGVRRSIYSWRLTNADPVPKGKRACKPLREMEQEIIQDKHDSIESFIAKSATLNDRFEVYIKGKIHLKPSTKQNYIYMYDKYARDTIGKQIMGELNYSVMQRFYNELITVHGFKPNSMEVMHTVLNPIFADAVADNIIRTNPCPRAMKKIRDGGHWERKRVSTKDALTAEQQKAFIDFIRSHEEYARWVNVITLLLGTGLRIGECTGLIWQDCDFNRNTISIHRTLIYRQWEDGTCRYRVMPVPKSKKGIRRIPMFAEVREALLAEQKHQEEVGTANTIVDGVGNWVFTNRYGTVLSPKSVNSAIERIIRDYNREEEALAKEAGRTPQLLPHITNHQLRHSFCTRLMEESCKPGSNIPLKLIQDIMGHADFSTTMDIYTDVSEKFKQDTMQAIQGSIYLG